MIGKRLAESRRRAGLAQVELAVALGDRYNQQMISNVETNRSGLLMDGAARAAQELQVSLDYLTGLTDDPTPSAQLSEAVKAADRSGIPGRAIAETRAAYDADGHETDVDMALIRRIDEVAPAAGSGAGIYSERVTGWVPFRLDWLKAHSIDPKHSNIVPVSGDSMEPALLDGCSILVDRKRREPYEGRIYVLRTEEGVVVKRLGLDEEGRWEARSDNPDWEPKLLTYGSDIVGEVRWSAVTHEG